MLASSCAASDSLSVLVSMSAEKEPPVGVGSEEEVLALLAFEADFAGRTAAIWPLVFNTAPFKRSSISQAFTPGFLESRCNASSIDSRLTELYWLLVWWMVLEFGL